MSFADESIIPVTKRIVYTSLRTKDLVFFQIPLKFFNRSSCSIVGTRLTRQFFTSSGHLDWPADNNSLRQRFNLIAVTTVTAMTTRRENHLLYSSDKNQETIEERLKLSNERLMPCGRFSSTQAEDKHTPIRDKSLSLYYQERIVKMTVFHFTINFFR